MTKQAIVVGGGPVGCVLSVLLARRGWQVEVYERRPDLRLAEHAAGRSINLVLTARGLRALEILGLKDQVLEITVPVYGRMMHALDGALAYQPYGKDDRERNYSVSRGDLNRYLLDVAEKSGVKVHFEQVASEVDVRAGRLVVTGPDGAARTLETPHLFGADGAPSAVRGGMQAVEGFRESLDMLPDGYKELLFPETPEGNYCMEVRALHIWPRGRHFLMGLPNQGGSFTGTLYLPLEGEESFATLTHPEAVRAFFGRHYPDAVPLLGDYVEAFLESPTGHLGTVRCAPWHVGERTLLVGDASHGIVPFFGQGLNSGFEDCAVLHGLLEAETPLAELFATFSQRRKPNTDAIADMALENYVEMRDKVGDPRFLLRKQVESRLERAYPELFRSRYAMVVYSSIPYAQAQAAGRIHDEILGELCAGIERAEDADLERGRELIDAKLTPFHAAHGISLAF
ncbi:MAG: FAD-dependent monooxygenase [Planctomycetes bacterium]|nr:FAD-dependent monooxygenase [Planctomycetota bacterium]